LLTVSTLDAQKLYKPKKKRKDFFGKVESPNDGKVRPIGVQVQVGPTYTLTRKVNQTFQSEPDSVNRYNEYTHDPSGKVGFFAEVGLVHFNMKEPKYKRILLKLSGESLSTDSEVIDPNILDQYASEIKKVHDETLFILKNESINETCFKSMAHKVKGGAQLLSAAKFTQACDALEQEENLERRIATFIQLLEEQNQIIDRYQSRYAKL
jgi:HPt (histidine-containing phosphotransfer) domain-containing protein